MAEETSKELKNWLVAGLTVFKYKFVKENGKEVKKQVEWQISLCGIYPTYKEAEFIMHKVIESYRKECFRKGIKPLTGFYIEETSKDVTTLKVGTYLEQQRGVRYYG